MDDTSSSVRALKVGTVTPDKDNAPLTADYLGFSGPLAISEADKIKKELSVMLKFQLTSTGDKRGRATLVTLDGTASVYAEVQGATAEIFGCT
eukprot:164198_1